MLDRPVQRQQLTGLGAEPLNNRLQRVHAVQRQDISLDDLADLRLQLVRLLPLPGTGADSAAAAAMVVFRPALFSLSVVALVGSAGAL